MSEEFDVSQAYAVDDEMQETIDQLDADALKLKPNRKGFTPSKLVKEPKEGSDERSAHWQDENVEVEQAGLYPLKDADGNFSGHRVTIDFKVVDGPNEGARIPYTGYMNEGEPDSAARANAMMQEVFSTLRVKPARIPKLDPKTGKQAKHPESGEPLFQSDYMGVLEKLVGKRAKVTVRQKWDHPWSVDNGKFTHLTDEPMKFTKKIVEVKA